MNPVGLETQEARLLLAMCGVSHGSPVSEVCRKPTGPVIDYRLSALAGVSSSCFPECERYTTGLEFVTRPFRNGWLTGHNYMCWRPLPAPIQLILDACSQNFTPQYRDKLNLLRIFTGMCLLSFVVLPFFLPALIRNTLAVLTTKIDPDRDFVCLQQTSYTCGPAAAVSQKICASLAFQPRRDNWQSGAKPANLAPCADNLPCWRRTIAFMEAANGLEVAPATNFRSSAQTVRKVQYQRFTLVVELKPHARHARRDQFCRPSWSSLRGGSA